MDLLNPFSADGGTSGRLATPPLRGMVTNDRPCPSGQSVTGRPCMGVKGHPEQALVVLQLNVCGIRQKAHEVTKLLHKRNADVALFQETLLKGKLFHVNG